MSGTHWIYTTSRFNRLICGSVYTCTYMYMIMKKYLVSVLETDAKEYSQRNQRREGGEGERERERENIENFIFVCSQSYHTSATLASNFTISLAASSYTLSSTTQSDQTFSCHCECIMIATCTTCVPEEFMRVRTVLINVLRASLF